MAGIAAWEAFEEGELPIDVPVRIETTFFLRRPKRLKPASSVVHIAKPDLDNLDKSLRDGLTSAGIFTDDCLICSSSSDKFYADAGESPRAEVVIKFDPDKDSDGTSS